jgi:hypothetical protein
MYCGSTAAGTILPQRYDCGQQRPSELKAVLSSGAGTVRVLRSAESPALLTLRGVGGGHCRTTWKHGYA